ncbi:MAG: hypothetical protein IKI04_02570 [Bacilli bacterium]|nr:hypothetical protein [Bacilli bacterium]
MDMKYKYMALFFHTVSMWKNEIITIETDEFKQLLLNFIMNYYDSNKELFDKIFNIKRVGSKYSYSIDYNEVMKYAMYIYEPKKLCKLYDEIGDDMIVNITDLAWLFCQYESIINDMNSYGHIRH